MYTIIFNISYINLESSTTPLLCQSPGAVAAKMKKRFAHTSVQPNLPQGLLLYCLIFVRYSVNHCMYLTLVFLTVTNILYILAKIAKVNTAEPPVPPAKSMPNLMSSDLSVMMPFCQVSSRWNLSYRHLWKVWNKNRAASVVGGGTTTYDSCLVLAINKLSGAGKAC